VEARKNLTGNPRYREKVPSRQAALEELRDLLAALSRQTAEGVPGQMHEPLARAAAIADALARRGHPWEPVFQQAVEWHESGNLPEAASLFEAILEHNLGHFPSLHRLAAIRRFQNRLEESLGLLERALACNPEAADIHNSLGNTLNALERRDEALEHYRRAVSLRPNFPEVHLNLGNTLKALDRFDEAAAAYRQAIALNPRYVEAHSNLGIVLARLNLPEEAIASFEAALAIDRGFRMVFNNLGTTLSALNRHQEAIACFQNARELEPDSPQPVFNESIAHLALGDFARGWAGYESRWRVLELKIKAREFAQPMWDGAADISGKTILLHAEQGLGDMIFFARFVRLVVERGARVVLEVQAPLKQLMSTIPGVVQVIAYGDPLPDFDVHAPFGSLPGLFHTTLETIPSATPYLFPPPLAGALPGGSPRIGVCWAGSQGYLRDYSRSIPLATFAPLFETPGVSFVSLQQNLRPGDEAILARYPQIDLESDRKTGGLAGTASLIAQLDLVITVDTVIGHLAGALGKPVWILLAYGPYWVWLCGRSDSPWYPAARLFRQPAVGDWQSVIAEAAAELTPMAALARSVPAPGI
jgi:tetratricopeptide (TPR) repeat protein